MLSIFYAPLHLIFSCSLFDFPAAFFAHSLPLYLSLPLFCFWLCLCLCLGAAFACYGLLTAWSLVSHSYSSAPLVKHTQHPSRRKATPFCAYVGGGDWSKLLLAFHFWRHISFYFSRFFFCRLKIKVKVAQHIDTHSAPLNHLCYAYAPAQSSPGLVSLLPSACCVSFILGACRSIYCHATVGRLV